MPVRSQKDEYLSNISNNSVYDFIEIIDPRGDFTRLNDINVIIKSLRNMLMTPLGTYFFDPTYGSRLHEYIFETYTDETKEEIIYEVQSRIELYDPRVTVNDVEVYFSKNDKSFLIVAEIERDEMKGELQVVLSEYNMQYSFDVK